MMSKVIILLTMIIHLKIVSTRNVSPVFEDKPCNGTDEILTRFEPGLSDGYKVIINKQLEANTVIRLKFDSEVNIILKDKESGSITKTEDNIFKIIINNTTYQFVFFVKGPIVYLNPYITSLKIKAAEYCNEPNLGYLEKYPVGAEKRPDVPDRFCGRIKVRHSGLIVGGKTATPGAWPWHVAINSINRGTLSYICGGTIISKHFVLTAAHCATQNGQAVIPESLGVTLGKYKLIGGDVTPQEKEVYKVIIHEDFEHKNLVNDIALLKLATEIRYNEFIQPACLWYKEVEKKLPSSGIVGTVTGWGFDQTDSLPSFLQETKLPMIDDLTCIRSKPLFYSIFVDGKRFCAGFHNGTSACNGDSGGGYVIYVPYIQQDERHPIPDGAWYVRGIVSLSAKRENSNLCNPNEYGIFTDIAAYTDWIYNNID